MAVAVGMAKRYVKEKREIEPIMTAVLSRKNFPNFITVTRIIGTICLLFLDAFSRPFYIVYTIAGLSDVLDGWLARRLKVSSELGAKLDSIADLLFYSVMAIKVLPILLQKLPAEIWIAVGIILVLRLCSYLVAAWKYKRFASLHTYMNKLTGAGVFLIPYTILLPIFIPFCAVLSVIAGIASGEELFIHIRNKEYHSDVKSIN